MNQTSEIFSRTEAGAESIAHSSKVKSSPGSIVLWVLVGVLVLSLFALLIWPEVEKVELNSRLSAADQVMAKYRTAVLSYYVGKGQVTMDVEKKEENQLIPQSVFSVSKKTPPKMIYVSTGSNLGESLIEAKLLEKITFPVGSVVEKRGTDSDESSSGETILPQIHAFPVDYLKERFHKTKPFESVNSEKVAILIVPGLTQSEAEGLQKRIGWMDDPITKAKKSNCFFTPSTTEKRYTAWIYLTDL
jgi:hypothetical protein